MYKIYVEDGGRFGRGIFFIFCCVIVTGGVGSGMFFIRIFVLGSTFGYWGSSSF